MSLACARTSAQPPATGSGARSADAAFAELARQILEDHCARNPSAATDLGLHQYDAQLEDMSEAALRGESQALRNFRDRLFAIEPSTLTLDKQLEGWAHYTEQMMLDEGFHRGDPKYRLAQLQDALLRDVRFIAGIRMHTQGMTVEEATTLFETAAHQPHPVALSEAKRGTADALYGYYTMGKLMILKLREDYKAKTGSGYSLRAFHDAFVRLGPLPLPLVRRALLGETGRLF
jgi:hypothetical protein